MIGLSFATALAASVLTTSFISGIFGMAGGMILMGILLALMPLSAAMALHGAAQVASNVWRAAMWRDSIRWRLVALYAIGALAALAIFATGLVAPGKSAALISLGAISFVGLCLPVRFAPNILEPGQAVGAGLLCSILQFICGVSGPILDTFFIRSELDRKTMVATKAAISTIGHFLKLVYFGHALYAAGMHPTLVAPAIAIILAPVGTQLSGRVLEALTDNQFRLWSRWLIAIIATFYLVQGVVGI